MRKTTKFAAVLVVPNLIMGLIAPTLFIIFFPYSITQSVTLQSATSILNDGITINGVILGFVLIVLNQNALKTKELGSKSPEYLGRLSIIVLDGGMTILTIREMFEEMLTLSTLSNSVEMLTIVNAFYIPVRFGIYVASRFLILMVASEIGS